MGGLDLKRLHVAQQQVVQGWAEPDRAPKIVGLQAPPRTGNLDEILVRRAVRAEQNGRAPMPSRVDAHLDPAAVLGARHHGGDSIIEEPDVLDGFERLKEHVASFQSEKFKMRLKNAEVL